MSVRGWVAQVTWVVRLAARILQQVQLDDVAALVAFVAGDAGDELTLRRTPDGFAAGSPAASPAGTPSD